MLSDFNLVFGAFINLFLVPIIGVKIYCGRHHIQFAMSSEKVKWIYVLLTVLNYPFVRVFIKAITNVIPCTIFVEESKYTVIAIVSCVILAYAMESIENLVNIDVLISLRNANHNCKKATKVVDENEK